MCDITNNQCMPSAPMLRQASEGEKLFAPSNGVGRVLIREDTVNMNMRGCACGRAQFTCAGVKNQWSSLCWGKQSEKKYYCSLVLLSFVFVLSLVGTVFFCFTNTIHDAILNSMVIKNNSMAYTMWQRPTVHPLMKVYLFNYTNWREVKDGLEEKLNVEEVGPYVYTQQMERVHVTFDDEDSISYQENNAFTFLPNMSHGALFDQVNVPNLPLLGLSSQVKDINSFSQAALNGILAWADHPEAFVKLPVHRFLWGYEDSIVAGARPLLALQGNMKISSDNFGLLVSKNGTSSDRFTINTGAHDVDKMNVIERLNGLPDMPYWSSQECDSVEASDGTIFPPAQLNRNSTLHVLFPNLCRRIPFEYVADVELSDGVKLLRYRMPRDVFDDPSHNPDNQCYCEIDSARCPPRGVINVTACNMGVPMLVSFPHFYLGAPWLREQMTGLLPEQEKHDNYLDIHPTLGISLNGKSALQLNIQVKKSNLITSLGFLKQDLILPIAWIGMVVDDLPDDIRSLVYHGTFSTAAAQLGLAITSIIALIVSSVCLLILLLPKRQKTCGVLKKDPAMERNEMKMQQNLMS